MVGCFKSHNIVQHPFCQIPLMVILDPVLSSEAKVLYAFLRYRAYFSVHEDGAVCTVSHVAQCFNVSAKSAQRWHGELIARGLIEKMSEPHCRSQYFLPEIDFVYGPTPMKANGFNNWLEKGVSHNEIVELFNSAPVGHVVPTESLPVGHVVPTDAESPLHPPIRNNNIELNTQIDAIAFSDPAKAGIESVSDPERDNGGVPPYPPNCQRENKPIDNLIKSTDITELTNKDSSLPSLTKESDQTKDYTPARELSKKRHPMDSFGPAKGGGDLASLRSQAVANTKEEREDRKAAKRAQKAAEKAERESMLVKATFSLSQGDSVELSALRTEAARPKATYDAFFKSMQKAGFDAAENPSIKDYKLLQVLFSRFEDPKRAAFVLTWSVENWSALRLKSPWLSEKPTLGYVVSNGILAILRNEAPSKMDSDGYDFILKATDLGNSDK